jgi:Mandelate racemase / muconate lactonizing enzyme, N-terminal domain/Enolase C-terminal domain-like
LSGADGRRRQEISCLEFIVVVRGSDGVRMSGCKPLWIARCLVSSMKRISRRRFFQFLGLSSGTLLHSRLEALAAPEKGKTRIRDIKVMMMQGPRTYTLLKVESDAGLHGIGEAYGSPGVGVKEQVLALKPELIGKDPLGIDVLMTGLGWRTDGSAHMLIRTASGIEMALWDLAGDHDIMVHCHWEYDLRTSIQIAEAIEPIKPLWLEDPMPVEYTESWRRLVASSKTPAASCTPSRQHTGPAQCETFWLPKR